MQTGDLIFSFIGPTDNAISSVTSGYRGARVNHMGVIVITPYGPYVLEAYPPEVSLTPFKVFRAESRDDAGRPRLMFARLHADHQHLISEAVSYGLKQKAKPYDDSYSARKDRLYCSELVVDMFAHANGGLAFFPVISMTFCLPGTEDFHPDWVSHYAELGEEIPEGAPGSNPGMLSLDERLTFYEILGDIPGYEA